MNKVEVGQILTLASGFDRFIVVDRVTTEAWFLVLADVDYEDAKAATVAHFVGPHAKETFGVRHILGAVADRLRTSVDAVEADVRSAKARSLVGKDWPAKKPLSDDVRNALVVLRESEVRALEKRFEFDQLDGVPVDVGNVGRSFR